jgi:uncharacterized protein YbjT (DUF2867 family)
VNPVFITGGTGYLGRPLIEVLIALGYEVHALVRTGSESKLPPGARPVLGDALDPATFGDAVPWAATIVHLVGTPHPSPRKAAEFRSIDLASIRATTIVARKAGAVHLVYVSAAHPAPVMKAYVAARIEGEALVIATGIPATILRPWYVLGPGRWWPSMLLPAYWIMEAIPATRAFRRGETVSGAAALKHFPAMVNVLARLVVTLGAISSIPLRPAYAPKDSKHHEPRTVRPGHAAKPEREILGRPDCLDAGGSQFARSGFAISG